MIRFNKQKSFKKEEEANLKEIHEKYDTPDLQRGKSSNSMINEEIDNKFSQEIQLQSI